MENGNQPINPISNEDNYENTTYLKGLTKREYFAAMAMQGLLSNPNSGKYEFGNKILNTELIADSSIKFADELLKQLTP